MKPWENPDEWPDEAVDRVWDAILGPKAWDWDQVPSQPPLPPIGEPRQAPDLTNKDLSEMYDTLERSRIAEAEIELSRHYKC